MIRQACPTSYPDTLRAVVLQFINRAESRCRTRRRSATCWKSSWARVCSRRSGPTIHELCNELRDEGAHRCGTGVVLFRTCPYRMGNAGFRDVLEVSTFISGNRGLDVEWQVAMRPGQRRKLEPGSPEAVSEKRKASVRAKVEHPFLSERESHFQSFHEGRTMAA